MSSDKRVEGRTAEQGVWWLPLVYRMMRKMMGDLTGKAVVPEPARITAHQPRLLWGVGQMEMAQQGMKTVAPALKSLAGLTAARQVGCPF